MKRAGTLCGFLNCSLILFKSPLTSIWLPAGEVEVSKRRELQESRINDLCQMQAVYDLCDHVFCVLVESLHQELESCVKWKLHVIVCKDECVDEYGGSE